MAAKCPLCFFDNPDRSVFCGKCGSGLGTQDRISLTRTLQTPAGRPLEGRALAGKFKILQEIGRGGMGVVYKAVDTQLKRTVALKFLSPDMSGLPSSDKRFIQEAQTASALNHPNICTIYEIGEAEGQAYIAMEYLEGRSLDCSTTPSEPTERQSMVRTVAAGRSQGVARRRPGRP